MRWVRHVAHTRNAKNAPTVLFGKPEGKTTWKVCIDGRIILKWILK
jgi:hypothetical protein